jgi:adenosine/AMP kinase
MPLPSQPVTLTVEQLADLNQKLSTMRHDINNGLAVTIAVAELIRRKPQNAENMADSLVEQARKIGANIHKFSAEFESAFGITRY